MTGKPVALPLSSKPMLKTGVWMVRSMGVMLDCARLSGIATKQLANAMPDDLRMVRRR
jgi:hypothetical protein